MANVVYTLGGVISVLGLYMGADYKAIGICMTIVGVATIVRGLIAS